MKKDPLHIEQYHLHKAHPEKLQFQVFDLESYLKKSGNHAQVPHSHSFYQILWIYNEGGVHYIDFDEHPVKTNTIFFIAKNQIHYFDKITNHKGILIHFNENFLMQSDVDIFLKYNVFNNQGKPCHCITEDIASISHSYIRLIQEELSKEQVFGHRQVIRYLLKSLLIVLERAHREADENDAVKYHPHQLKYLKFRELLELHYDKNLSVSDYASKLHISTKTLTTITKSAAVKTPSDLISERVILEAKRLLSYTELKVNEVGYRLGFDDPSYFVKFFKRHLKKSPKDYRKITS